MDWKSRLNKRKEEYVAKSLKSGPSGGVTIYGGIHENLGITEDKWTYPCGCILWRHSPNDGCHSIAWTVLLCSAHDLVDRVQRGEYIIAEKEGNYV